MKTIILIVQLLITSTALAAPEITDTFSIGGYNVYMKAELSENNYFSNIGISVENLKLSNKRIAKYFLGPAKIQPRIDENGSLILEAQSPDGSTKSALLTSNHFQLSNCVTADNYRVCIDQHSSNLSGFGSNISTIVIHNLDLINSCGGGRSISHARKVATNRNFNAYYFPNTFADFNIDPISSVRVITRNGKKFIELKGQFGVYNGKVISSERTEYLDVSKFINLNFSKGHCPDENGQSDG